VSDQKWDLRYGEMAKLIASWSKDPSTQVGAVIVRQNKSIASMGFNGFPPGMEDKPEWLNDRTEKLKRMIHAENNALNYCLHENITGSTIYVYPLHPCSVCVQLVINRGIKRVVTVTTKEKHDYMSQIDVWQRYNFDQTFALLDFAEIKHETIIL
jgi:dCMP deaminase